MNRFLYLLFILMVFYFNAKAKDLVLVKYSKLDCVLCNMQIYNLIQKVGTTPMIVVFKSESSSDQSQEEIKRQLAESSITIIYSDSLFYFADSSNRSMVYVIKNDSVTYYDYLKTFDPVKLSSALSEGNRKGNINFPDLSAIRQDRSSIYLIGNKIPYILRIDKKNLMEIADTIKFSADEIKMSIFRSFYGNRAQQALDSFLAISASRPQRPDNYISDFFIEGNRFFLIANTNAVKAENNNSLTFFTLPALVEIEDGKIVSTKVLNYYKHFKAKNHSEENDYTINATRIFKWEDQYYCPLYKKTLSDQNFLLGHLSDNKATFELDNIMPYSLPGHLTKEKIGYMMTSYLYSNGIVSNVFSDTIFSLAKKKNYKLELGNVENSFTKQQADNLNLTVNFEIIGINYENNCLEVLYKTSHNLLFAKFKKDETIDAFKRIAYKKITSSFPNEEFGYAAILSNDLIYFYEFYAKRFMYFSCNN